MSKSDFADRLGVLCSQEMCHARRDPERMGVMIERLVNSLAFTLAIAASGNAEQMTKLLTGAESHLYECATGHAKFAELFEAIKDSGRP